MMTWGGYETGHFRKQKNQIVCKLKESLWLWGWLGPEKVLCNIIYNLFY